MAIEHASVQAVRKPWGVGDLHPWSSIDGSRDTVGELWFQRVDENAQNPAFFSLVAPGDHSHRIVAPKVNSLIRSLDCLHDS